MSVHLSRLMYVRLGKTQISREDSDQPGHPPSLIRVFAVHMKKALVLSYPLSAQRRLWSDWGMPRLIWVFAWRTVILLVLSWGGSFIQAFPLPLNRNSRQSKSIAVLSYWSNRNRFPKTNKRKTVIDRTWNTAKRKSICLDGWMS